MSIFDSTTTVVNNQILMNVAHNNRIWDISDNNFDAYY